MTDDFDKLPPDDEPEESIPDWLSNIPIKPSDESDDSGALDWMNAVGAAESPSSDELDLGGELDWLSTLDESAAPSEQENLWQADQPASPTAVPRSLGLTGKLDWQQALGSVEQPEDEPTDWISGFQTEDEPVEEEQPDSLDWLQNMEAQPESAAFDFGEEAAAPAESLPENMAWLQQYAATDESVEEASEPEEAVPDWLMDAAPVEAGLPAAEAQNLFEEAVAETESTTEAWLDEFPAMEDLTGSPAAVPAPADERIDWFAEPVPDTFDVADENVPDWLQGIEAQPTQTDALLFDQPNTGLFREMEAEALGATEPPTAPMSTGELRDIDALLASYEGLDPNVVDRTGQLMSTEIDIDKGLIGEGTEPVRESPAPRKVTAPLPEGAPSWLSEIGGQVASVESVSAGAILRQQAQTERPAEELPDRLKALRQAAAKLPASGEVGMPEVMRNLLPGVSQAIPAAAVRPGQPGLTSEVVINQGQRDKINLLRTLVAADDEKSAIDRTLESLEDEAGLIGATPVVKTRPRRRFKIDRLLIAVLLAAAVILPFVVPVARIGNLPPAQFKAGSRQQMALDRLQRLQAGDLALIAVEYGPTGAGELDSLLEALLRHVFIRGARPIVTGSNPVGLLHARQIVEEIGAESGFLAAIGRQGQPLVANLDYYVTRYLAGEAVGLRDFSQNLPVVLATDIQGLPTNLSLQSITDIKLVAVVAERGDDVRNWAEQVIAAGRLPLVIAASASAGPLAEPYVAPNSSNGLLVGYRDAYTYRAILDGVQTTGIEPVAQPNQLPLPQLLSNDLTATLIATINAPTPTPTATLTPSQTFTPSVTPSASVTPSPTLSPTTTNTPTDTPTVTPSITSTPRPTLPPTWTPTIEGAEPIAAPGTVILGVNNTSDAINVREGPGRDFARVAALGAGQEVQIIGRNDDGSWLQVRLEDDTEGWVLAELIRIQEPGATPTQSAYQIDPNAVVVMVADSNYLPVALQSTPVPEGPPGAAPLPRPGEAVSSAPVEPVPYRDERWYSMTLGLVVIIIVILLGAVINILRSLFQRGRS